MSFLEHSGFVLRRSFLRKRYHFNEISKANTIFCWNKHIPSYYHCLPDLKLGPHDKRRLIGSLTGFESPVAVSYLRCNQGSHCYIISCEEVQSDYDSGVALKSPLLTRPTFISGVAFTLPNGGSWPLQFANNRIQGPADDCHLHMRHSLHTTNSSCWIDMPSSSAIWSSIPGLFLI